MKTLAEFDRILHEPDLYSTIFYYRYREKSADFAEFSESRFWRGRQECRPYSAMVTRRDAIFRVRDDRESQIRDSLELIQLLADEQPTLDGTSQMEALRADIESLAASMAVEWREKVYALVVHPVNSCRDKASLVRPPDGTCPVPTVLRLFGGCTN